MPFLDVPLDETPTERVSCNPGPPAPAPPAPDFATQRGEKRTLLAEQRDRWVTGTPAPPEDFLARWPTDPVHDSDVATLLAQDLLARQERGEPASPDDYRDRFPKQREALAALLSRRDLLRSFGDEASTEPARLRFPDVGEVLFGFRLQHELGRGAFARVFLAEQTALGNRPVAVKVSAIEGREPQTLAQMQHTHIVPIYSVQEDDHAGLRAVCMPYFGGASLSVVLKDLWAVTKCPHHGSEFVAALQRCSSPTLPGAAAASPHAGRTPLAVLGEGNYVRATVWLVARLAEGLQHAHERGVLHRDIKPSNILVGSDGQPMLLDFNLSADQQNGSPAEAVLGGTIAYMSPEHLRALIARNRGVPHSVDHRADIYSLGMVLYEMLAGGRPFDLSGSYSVMPLRLEEMAAERARAAPSLRERRADVPWSLESIARKCLAPDPAQRYQHAEDFAEDLRAILEDRPLRFAPELSRVERVRKWSRRNPRLTSAALVTLVAGALLSGAGFALASLRTNLAGAQAELGTAQARDRKREHDTGTAGALCLVTTKLDSPEHLRQGIAACERTLAVYGSLDGTAWREHPDWRSLPPGEQVRLREDTRELLLLLATARVSLNPTDPVVLRSALALLDRAETVTGLARSRALELDRARYLAALGDTAASQEAAKRAEQIPVTTAAEHYLHATALARTGDTAGYTRAIAALDKALALDPRHYWSWFARGICHTALGDHVLAAGDFGHCAGLWPDFAWGHFNQGYVFEKSGKKVEAVAAYTRALERDPDLVAGYLNRGLVRLDLGQWRDALGDFDRTLAAGRTDPAIHAGRGVALESLRRFAEADRAFGVAFESADAMPPVPRQRMQLAYAFAVAPRLPRKAEETFRDILDTNPRSPQALYGLAMLAMQDGKNADAIRVLTQALDASPDFHEARRYRAVALARGGSIKQAADDINWCLEREPQSGESLYAAACVAALAARTVPDPQFVNQALDLLDKAFARSVGLGKAATDPDLAALKALPRFKELVARYRDRRD